MTNMYKIRVTFTRVSAYLLTLLSVPYAIVKECKIARAAYDEFGNMPDTEAMIRFWAFMHHADLCLQCSKFFRVDLKDSFKKVDNMLKLVDDYLAEES